MEERTKKLRDQVDELLTWKADNERVQVPLSSYGKNSIDIRNRDQVVFTGRTSTPQGNADVWIEILLDDDTIVFPAKIVL